ncbi:MAG: M23 family metallopeptidase [Thermodesulfobacteriota bacterium]
MNDKLHIIITTEHGTPRTLLYSKKWFVYATLFTTILFSALATGSFLATKLYIKNTGLNNQVSTLNNQLEDSTSSNSRFASRIDELEILNTDQASQFKAEKEELLNTTVSELKERSQLIETVMNNIGVKIDKSQLGDNKGGPFIAAESGNYDDLLFKSDHYLEAIKTMPIGRPVPGRVTSRYGVRKDPVNGKKSHHYGVDFRGKSGTPVIATADGKVVRANNNGSFGRYVKINHGNGYTTAFAHLKEFKVKKGDRVKRGQVIALVGSSGRSTGPHLHYEIRRYKKPVSPVQFMAIDKLAIRDENGDIVTGKTKK